MRANAVTHLVYVPWHISGANFTPKPLGNMPGVVRGRDKLCRHVLSSITFAMMTDDMSKTFTSCKKRKGSDEYVSHVEHDGYLYHLQIESLSGTKFYRCRRRSANCRGRLLVRPDGERVAKGAHVHEPEPEKGAALRIEAAVRASALAEPMLPPKAVVEKHTEYLKGDVVACLSEDLGMRNKVRRARRQAGLSAAFPEPSRLADIDIPEALRYTKKSASGPAPVRFLLHDSGADDPDRFVIYVTDDMLDELVKVSNFVV